MEPARSGGPLLDWRVVPRVRRPGRLRLALTAALALALLPTIPIGSAAEPSPADGLWRPGEHRVGVRVVEGVGELYDRATGESVRPRGSNFHRWVWKDVPGSGRVVMDSLLNTEWGQLEAAGPQLGRMAASGFDLVRIWANACWGGAGGCLGDPRGGLSDAYLDNLAAFLRLARDHGIYVILTDDEVPADGGYQPLMFTDRATFDGYNANFLTEGGIEAERRFYRDLIEGLRARDAPMEAVLAWELRNEAFYEAQLPPLSWTAGSVTTANGATYDMARRADRARMMEEGWLHWIEEVAGAIREVDPTALVTMGFFAPQPPDDPRLVDTGAILRHSALDLVDLHAYAGHEPLADVVERFELRGVHEKPVLMGEFGALKQAIPDIGTAAYLLQAWQVESCRFGFDGWAAWTWGAADADSEFWDLTDGDGEVEHALAPTVRPDPCQPGDEMRGWPNLAHGKRARASASESPGYEPSNVIDESLGTWWSAGDGPPQWIEVDLGGAYRVRAVELHLGWVAPRGPQRHRVSVAGPGRSGRLRVVGEIDGVGTKGGVLRLRFRPPLEGVRRVRVETLSAEGWVILHELKVLPG